MALFGRIIPRPVRVQFLPVPVSNQYLPSLGNHPKPAIHNHLKPANDDPSFRTLTRARGRYPPTM